MVIPEPRILESRATIDVAKFRSRKAEPFLTSIPETDRPLDALAILRDRYADIAIVDLDTYYGDAFQMSPSRVRALRNIGLLRHVAKGIERKTIGDYLAGRTNRDVYLGNLALYQFPELFDCYKSNGSKFIGNNRMPIKSLAAIELFIGNRGTQYSVLHLDSHRGTVVSECWSGEKEWMVYPPEDSAALRAYSIDGKSHLRLSDFDPWDVEDHPLYQVERLHPIRIIQRPGDLLLLPPDWWHTAKNNQDCTITVIERFWSSYGLLRAAVWQARSFCRRPYL